MRSRSFLLAGVCATAVGALPNAAHAATSNCKKSTTATIVSGHVQVAELTYGPDTLNPGDTPAEAWSDAPKQLAHPNAKDDAATFYRAVTRSVLTYGGGRYTFEAGAVFFNINCYSYYAVGDTKQHPSIMLETGKAKVETRGSKAGIRTFDVFATYKSNGTFTVTRTRTNRTTPFGTTKVSSSAVLEVNLLHLGSGNCHYVRKANYTTKNAKHGITTIEKVLRR